MYVFEMIHGILHASPTTGAAESPSSIDTYQFRPLDF